MHRVSATTGNIEKQSIKYRIILKQSKSVTGYVPNIMSGDSNEKEKK